MGRPPRIYAQVERDIWLSADFRKLSAPKPNGRTLFKYLLSSPRGCAIPGVVVAHPRVMASDLEWSDRAFERVLAELVAAGMVEHDRVAGLTVVTKALIADGRARATHAPTTTKSVITWVRALSRLPICPLRDAVAGRMSLFFTQLGGQFPKAFADAMGDSCTQLIAVREPTLVHQGTGNREQGSPLSLGRAREAAGPADQLPDPMPRGTLPAEPPVRTAPPTFAPLARYAVLAVELLNAERAAIDPEARPLPPADQALEVAIAAHVRSLPEAEREPAIRHGVAMLGLAVRAGVEPMGALRPGELCGPRSWGKWQAATPDDFQPRAARGRAAPPGSGSRPPSREPTGLDATAEALRRRGVIP